MSMAAAAAAAIPVVFFDGAQSISLGTVAVHPALGFKRFQAAIAQRIGVAPHQISASLVRARRARRGAAAEELRGRRVPIDESSDLAAIARDAGESYVLAAVRRPRRERRSRSRRGGGGDGAAAGSGGGNKKAAAAAPEKTILRRSAGPGSPMIVAASPETMGLELGFWDYETQLRNLQRQRESYLLSTAAMAGYYPYGGADAAEAAAAAAMVCSECEAAEEEGRGPEFHWCVRDAVTRGFRSPLGPIERPPKKPLEASA